LAARYSASPKLTSVPPTNQVPSLPRLSVPDAVFEGLGAVSSPSWVPPVSPPSWVPPSPSPSPPVDPPVLPSPAVPPSAVPSSDPPDPSAVPPVPLAVPPSEGAVPPEVEAWLLPLPPPPVSPLPSRVLPSDGVPPVPPLRVVVLDPPEPDVVRCAEGSAAPPAPPAERRPSRDAADASSEGCCSPSERAGDCAGCAPTSTGVESAGTPTGFDADRTAGCGAVSAKPSSAYVAASCSTSST
jgi:hypothetical protein